MNEQDMSDPEIMDTQKAIDLLAAYIAPQDIKARRALTAIVVKVTQAADALGASNDMVEEWRDALEAAFGPKPAELSAVEWIATLRDSLSAGSPTRSDTQ